MVAAEPVAFTTLYESDETAWLEAMAALAAEGRTTDMDFANLSEYLADMAMRDRREVASRLRVLLAHLLQWQHQPERRSGGWLATIEVQRFELDQLLESETLKAHASGSLENAFAAAARQAAAETGLDVSAFPVACPFTLRDVLTMPIRPDQS